MSNILMCPRCGSAYSATGGVEPLCPTCNARCIETAWEVDAWRNLTDSQKQQEKDKFIAEHSNDIEEYAVSPVEIAEHVGRIAHDIHVIYILILINLVMSLIFAGIIISNILS